MSDFPIYKQLELMDCGPTCLRMVAKHFNKDFTIQTLRERAQINKEGVSLLGIAEAAESIGIKAVGVNISVKELITEMPLPCILHWGESHFVVLYKIKRINSLLCWLHSTIRGTRTTDTSFKSQPPLGARTNDLVTKPMSSTGDKGQKLTSVTEDLLPRSIFYIADPATGKVSYTTEEFRRKWLGSPNNKSGGGIALGLDPTPRFYEEEGEKGSRQSFAPMFKYLRNYKNLLVQLVFGLLAGSGLSLMIPLLTQSLVDIGIGTQSLSFVNMVLIAQLVLLLATAVIDFLRSWVLLYISTRLNVSILSGFITKLLRLPISFFDVRQFGDIMQRMNDHNRIETFLTGQTLNILFSFFNLIVFGVVLAFYDFTIFQVAVGFSIVYVIWITSFLKKRKQLDTKRFEVTSINQSQIVHLIQGMQDIKLSGAESSKLWEWEKTQVKLFKWSVKHLSLSQHQQAGALLINNGKNILITFLAAKSVIDGSMTLGAMVSIQYILAQFNAPVEQMMVFLQSWQDAQISLDRLAEIHQIPDEEPYDSTHVKEWDKHQHIFLRGIWFKYVGAGNEPVLKNINLKIPFGKTTAIVGASGSGKTTLLKLLLRFHEPQQGGIYLSTDAIELDKTLNINNISHRRWREECGVVMQEGFIFSDTIAKNIAVAEQDIDTEKLRRAARTANIHNFIETLPLGYRTRIGTEGSGLSQGQKQRILIARAVYKNPSILLFDEATNALDATNEAMIIGNLNQFFCGRTVVVVAHRLSTVKNADQIIVMEKGEIAETGTHNDLLLMKGKYFELVSNQLPLV